MVGVVQAPHSGDQKMFASKAFDGILSGDDHDLVIIIHLEEWRSELQRLLPVDSLQIAARGE